MRRITMAHTLPAPKSPLPTLLPGGSIERYISEVQKFPMLDEAEEFMLAKRWQAHQDMSAAHRMVTSHLRLVVKMAQGFRGYGLPVAELISEGTIGLMQAVKRFDPDKGFRLATYAMWWIKASMQEYVLRSWSLVKVGSSATQKRLFFNLKKLRHRLDAADHGDLTPEQVAIIARELDADAEEVVAMDRRMMAHDPSLNMRVGLEGDTELQDTIAESGPTQETLLIEHDESRHKRELMKTALGSLNERERAILQARRLQEPAVTLEELSQRYSISRERVRQIENRAFEKLVAHVAEQG